MTLFFKDLSSGESGAREAWQAIRGGGAPDRALAIAAVYGAVSLIADTFATLPMRLLTGDRGRRRTLDLPSWLVRPDARIDHIAWRYQFSTSLKLRGNAYGLVIRKGAKILGVRWVNPDAVTVKQDGTIPVYVIGEVEHTLWAHGGDLLHVAEFVQPGSVVGLSPLENFRKNFEIGLGSIDYGREWFRSTSNPSSMLTSKQKLKPGEAAEAKYLFRQSVADGGPVVLDVDWDYKSLTVSPQDAQFLQTIRATATTIATIFRVPPDDIGGEAASARTYGNRQDDAERFVQRTMLPHVKRFEGALAPLLPSDQFLKLNFDGLTRPNLLERARVNTEQLRNGTRTLAEIRDLEDLAPLTAQQIEQWQEWFANRSESTDPDQPHEGRREP